MGARFRLKASFDISGFSPANQTILRALKKYGMMVADNGSAWFLSGAPDARWNNDDLHNLGRITGSSFEGVDVNPLMLDPNSGQARQAGVSVSVTPATANVNLNSTKQFSASVQSSADQTVSWSVNGVPGGNASAGSINSAGLYFAPTVVPSPATVIVEAHSNSTPSAFGTASVTLIAPAPVTVSVSPSSATVRVGRTQTFTATVSGTPNKAVLWKVNGVTSGNSTVGSISGTGVYTAPASVPSPGSVVITAVSVAAPAISAQATVQIVRRR